MIRAVFLVCFYFCLLPSAVTFLIPATTCLPCIQRRMTPPLTCLMAAAAEPEDNSSLRVNNKPPPPPPPPPPFQPKPLALILSAGLFLFPNSVAPADRSLANALLRQAQTAMRADPVLTMELGQTMETGGVYASQSSLCNDNGAQQLVLQFQIEGGNAWAQGIAYGIQTSGVVQLVSLQVANMDANMNGTSYNVPLPSTTISGNTKPLSSSTG